MKLKDFMLTIEKELEDFINLKIDFDLGIDTNMDVIDLGSSPNRIKFSIIKKKPKKKR